MMRRALLLLYSLSPGLAKLSGVDAFFGVGLLLLMAYLALLPTTRPAGGAMTTAVRFAIFFFVAYGLVLGVSLWLAGVADPRALLVGSLGFLVPLFALAAAGPERAGLLLRDLPGVALVHAVLALVLYPPWRPDIAALQRIGDTLLEGTMAFRLSSVSGSLALSTVMTVAFALSLQRHMSCPPGSAGSRRAWTAALLFLCCGFLSLQRAAWIALGLVWLVAMLGAMSPRRRSVLSLLVAACVPAVAAVLLVELPADALEILVERFGTLTGGGEIGVVAERADQWLNALYNLRKLPTGHGTGQIGQPVRETGPLTGGLPVYDGDYFRIVSEYGAFGLALVLLIAAGTLRALMRLVPLGRHPRPEGHAILPAALLGIALQGIGTNVTELYFANAVFWALWIQSWQSPDGMQPAVGSCPPFARSITGATAR